MAETIEGLKQWLDINYPKKLPFETVETTGLPTDSPMFPALIRYSTEDEQVYSWSIDKGIGSWKIGMGGSGSGIKYELKSSNFIISKGTGYLCDLSSISTQMTASFLSSDTFEIGDFFEIFVVKGDSKSKNIVVDFVSGGHNLESVSENFTMDYNSLFRFIYIDSTIGWKVIPISLIGTQTNGEEIVSKSANFTIENNTTYLVDTTFNIITATVPTNITYPFKFRIIDLKNTTNVRNINVNFITNGNKFRGNLVNDIIHFNGTMCEYIAVESTYGFTKNELRSNDVCIYALNKYYSKGDRCYWCGFLAEANDNIATSTGFKWGTTGATWKPIDVNGNWKGMYNVSNSYLTSDLVVTYDSSNTIYTFVGSASAGDTSYNPNTGVNKDRWRPINFNGSDWFEGATDIVNGRQGVIPPPQKGDNKKVLWGDANWASPYIIGEVKTLAISTVPSGWLLCDGSAISRTTYSDLFSAISTIYGIGDNSTTFNLPNFNGRTPIGTGQLTFNTSFNYTDINISTDIITVLPNNTLYTGTPVTITTSGTIPAGLVLATTYYVIKLNSTTIKLATTLTNALGSTAINITTQGTGVHTLTYIGANRTLGNIGGEENHSITYEEIQHAHNYGGGSVGNFNNNYWASNSVTDMRNLSGIAGNNMQPYLVLNMIIKY